MDINHIIRTGEEEIRATRTLKELEDVRIRILGRKGSLTNILRSLSSLPMEERRSLGARANEARKAFEELFVLKAMEFAVEAPLAPSVDLTMPAARIVSGHLHPLTILEARVREIFSSMNFSVVSGPELETEHYNFDALNIPPAHPARDMWDTFWIKTQTNADNTRKHVDGSALLLRTHTSPMQIRYMEKHEPPFQIIVPGRVFRYEATDASHEINFTQVEGLMVGKNVTLANLKYVIETFLKKILGDKTVIRFRPSYFPFTEPSIEVDIKIPRTSASGPRMSAWLEIMGAGMVHPNVFSHAGYVPDGWQGFAFGLGLDRIAILKYGIPDIRLFYGGDARFTRQFKTI